MEKNNSPAGFSRPPNTPKGRVRQQRTVYSVEQREELERFFQNSHYPTYDERETLAARLNLQEQQVQVWFKNRRAKHRKSLEAAKQPRGTGDASFQDPGDAIPAPEPVPLPSAAGPKFPEDLVFRSTPRINGNASGPGFSGVTLRPGFFGVDSPRGFSGEVKVPEFPGQIKAPGFSREVKGPGFSGEVKTPQFSGDALVPGFSGDATVPGGTASTEDPGFYRPPPPNVFGGVAAAETSNSSYTQVWWDPAQDAQNPVPASAANTAETSAPAAAQVWPEDPCISDFDSDDFESPTLADLLSSRGPLLGPFSSESGSSKDEDSGSTDDSGPKLLDL